MVPHLPPHFWYKLAKNVGKRATSKAFGGAEKSVLPVGFALGAPGVGEKIVADRCHISRIGRVALPIGVVRAESEVDDVLHPVSKRVMYGVEIAWIFGPG